METYITSNMAEILSGTSYNMATAYVEAVKRMEGPDEKKLAILRKFMKSINSRGEISNKAIRDSKGDIMEYSKYNDVVMALDKMKPYLSKTKEYGSLVTILDELKAKKAAYVRAYEKDTELLKLIYESSVFMLMDGINYMLINCIDISDNKGSTEIKFTGNPPKGVITKTLNDLAAELSGKSYDKMVDAIIKTVNEDGIVNESVLTESGGSIVEDVVSLIERVFSFLTKHGASAIRVGYEVVKSLFNIVPIIRNIIFIHYKHKVSKIENYEIMMKFIQMNIDQLSNKNMDPAEKEKIIRKQQAKILEYRKRADKLRAQFTDTEQQIEKDVADDNASIKDSDDFEI